jgi:hypothetical protein
MNTKLAGFVAASRYHASFIAAHQHRLAFQRRIIQNLHRHKKGVEIKMGDIGLLPAQCIIFW